MASCTMTLMGIYNYDNNIFDSLHLPSNIDRQTAIDTILLRCGEFEVLYPEPNWMRFMIRHICDKWALSFQKWADLTQVEYNPIHNYDRHETYTDDSESKSKGTGDSLVTSFDSDALHQDGQTISDAEGTAHNAHDGHLYGNIGVTKTQEMMLDEVDLRNKFNAYELIADVFARELTIMVY